MLEVFFVGMNYHLFLITYHYHRFLHPLVMAAFELTINYYHGIADAKKLFWSSNFMFCLEFLEANIPHPSFFGTDTMVWILPTLKGMFLLENPRPRGMEKYEKYEFFLEWIIFQHGGDFLPVRRL